MHAKSFDVVIVGAGAAGLMCAATAGQRGRRVLLLDHSDKLAEKIRLLNNKGEKLRAQRLAKACVTPAKEVSCLFSNPFEGFPC